MRWKHTAIARPHSKLQFICTVFNKVISKMHLFVCSSSSSVSVGAAGRARVESTLACCSAYDLQYVVRPAFVKIVRIRREKWRCRFLVRRIGIAQTRVRTAVGAGEAVKVAASAAAFEEGTSVNGRMEKSAIGLLESCSDSEGLMPGGGADQGRNLVHALHDAARAFQLGLEKQKNLASRPWFPQKWLGVDKNAWMKSLAYQAAVHSLLQAVVETAGRGEGLERDAHGFVKSRLVMLSSPLEDSIRHELSSRDPSADDWLWLQQHPLTVASFVKFLEKDMRFTAVTSMGQDGASCLSKGLALDFLQLAIRSCAAVMTVGAAAVSNPLFSSTLSEKLCDLMQNLPKYITMDQVYLFTCSVGLKLEFLENFGPRAADDKKWEQEKEGEFWVYVVQQLLRGALVREGVRSRLKSQDTVEVLERDLAVFGFFATLGRSTRSYLAAKGVPDSEESLASLLRYLEGGSVLFYPQLTTLSIYQLFIEVVCEEMEWLPFYPESPPVIAHGENGKLKTGIGKAEKRLAIAVAVQVCSLWINSFAEHSAWVQQPEGFRAATFVSKSQLQLEECNKAYELVKRITKNDSVRIGANEDDELDRLLYQELRERSVEEASSSGALEGMSWNWNLLEGLNISDRLTAERRRLQEMEQQLKSIDKELQSAEVALAKLELLVKESETSSVASGRDGLHADLDKIRLLKREVEVLEVSFKAKVEALEERTLDLQVEQKKDLSGDFQRRSASQDRDTMADSQSQRRRWRPMEEPLMINNIIEDGVYDEKRAELTLQEAAAISKDVKTFELLLGELTELESRIQHSAEQSTSVRSLSQAEWERASVYEVASTSSLARIEDDKDAELAGEYGGWFSKSIEKLKDASVDVWRGSCLLGTDVGAALVLLRRNALGQKLTSREQKILKRTLTDLASVVPIGFLMLLPVTAVGHAAILAAIQKYVPALIPSAYGPERLDVLRRLEQLRHMEPEVPTLPPGNS